MDTLPYVGPPSRVWEEGFKPQGPPVLTRQGIIFTIALFQDWIYIRSRIAATARLSEERTVDYISRVGATGEAGQRFADRYFEGFASGNVFGIALAHPWSPALPVCPWAGRPVQLLSSTYDNTLIITDNYDFQIQSNDDGFGWDPA